MEYLERGTVIEAVDKHLNAVLNKADDNVALDIGVAAGYDMAHRHCVDLLRNLPAADVAPVVRCGECKHWFDNGTDLCSCDRDALLRRRDFFCADGERKDGDGDGV